MAYTQIDSGSPSDWESDPLAESFDLDVSDWGVTDRAMLVFGTGGVGKESFVSRRFSSPVWFDFLDAFERPQTFNELQILLRMEEASDPYFQFTSAFRSPETFRFTFSLWNEGEKLREWFIPIVPSGCCKFDDFVFDLKPLIAQGFQCFDELRIGVLGNPGEGLILVIGDSWLLNDELEHNFMLRVSEMLHRKMRKVIGRTFSQAQPGDGKLVLADAVDLNEYMAIEVGDPVEMHVIESAAVSEDGSCALQFTASFSGKQIRQVIPPGQDVVSVIPCVFSDLSEAEAVFPVFHLTRSAPSADESITPMGKRLSNFVRDDENGHTVAVSKARDGIRMLVMIGVFASTEETVVEMWSFLRSVFNRQNFITICGVDFDYQIDGVEEFDPRSAREGMPTRIMTLSIYGREDVHEKAYQSFPPIQSVTVGIEATAQTSDRIRLPRAYELPPNV